MADYSNPKASNAILGDLQEIVALIQSGAKMDPSGNTNIPNGAKRVVAVTGGYQIQSYNGSTWVSIGKLIHDCDTLDGKHTNTGTTANTIPVRDQNGALPGNVTGNAATATKLQAARTIDLGGIVSATEQSFDGSKPITIPVNSVNVNNEQDNALVGEVSKLHGGTGRTDGAAADVVVSSAQGEVKASAYGQIGDARLITGQDLDTLTVSGNYITRGGTVANHYPRNIQGASCTVVRVSRAATHILQTIICSEGDTWVRRSVTTGGSWIAWQPITGTGSSIRAIYISKSGSDDNTGLSNDQPVLTIERAMRIAKGWAAGAPNIYVQLCLGEGNWGNVSFGSLPFVLQLKPYDNTSATEYSASLPTFTDIEVYNCVVQMYGVVADRIYANTGFAQILPYGRCAEFRAAYKGTVLINGDTTPIDIYSKASHEAVFYAHRDGMIVLSGARTFNIIENLNVTNFMSVFYGGCVESFNLATFTLAEGVAVTGKKHSFDSLANVYMTKDQLDALPGSTAGTIGRGCHISTGIWGGGDAHTFMAADASWRKDSDAIYARDVAVNGDTSDMASARGQIGDNYQLPDNVDLNDVRTSGFYGVRGVTATNVPGMSWYALWVMDGYGSNCTQVAISVSTPNPPTLFARSYDGSTWSAWTQLNTNNNPYAIFTGATTSAAGTKGLVPAPSANSNIEALFLCANGTFKRVPYLRHNVSQGEYKDALEYSTGSNRIAVFRIGNEMYDGKYTILLGVNNEADSAPAGLEISRILETNAIEITASGDFKVTGNLSVTGSISGQNAFSTGDFCWSYASSKTGFLLCNGAAISRTTYADLYAIIGTKFGTGDGSTTFNLPDMRGRTAQGANGNLGSVLAAGLPNITGNVSTHTQLFWAGGAFGLGTGGNRASGGYGGAHIRFDFDASRCSSIYGNSSTVQPPAIALNCFIKY